MAKETTAFLGISIPVPGSAEPFRVADVNAAFETIDAWAVDVDQALGNTALLESGLAAGTKPVAAAGVTGVLPVSKGGTGGTNLATARAGLEIYVQDTQPSSTVTGALWFAKV